MIRSIKKVVGLTIKKIFDPYFAGGAAEVSFFLLLSLVPVSILLAQILDLFTLSLEATRGVLTDYLSSDVMNVILPLLEYNPSSALGVFMLILAIWAGSKFLVTLMRICNYAYHGGSPFTNPVAGYIRERIRALLTVLLVVVTIVLALYILVFGEELVKVALKYVNSVLGIDYNISTVWYVIRWIIALIVFFFVISSLYYVLPRRHIGYSDYVVRSRWQTVKNILKAWIRVNIDGYKMILPGALFATLTTVGATYGYAFYMRHIASGGFNILYGGLSSIIFLLLWFYLIAFLLIVGIQLNASIVESKKVAVL
ncbi:MAG: YihY/virulence factor BrkB family protein [Clostridiales Family XIII bacterium]|jgi:membrane protein|nr:YihY/virulence factor BrkB family protein [Clostridiales Family XIII bacterium]